MNTSRLPTQPDSQGTSRPGTSMSGQRLARSEWLSKLPDNPDLDPDTISDVERWKHETRIRDIILASQVDEVELNRDIWKAAASGRSNSIWERRPRHDEIVRRLHSYVATYMADRQRVSGTAHQQIATSLGVDHDLWSKYIDRKLTPDEIETAAKEWPALGGDLFEEKIKSLPVWETAEGSQYGDQQFRHELSKASRQYCKTAKSFALATWLSIVEGGPPEISEDESSLPKPSFFRDDNWSLLRERPETPNPSSNPV